MCKTYKIEYCTNDEWLVVFGPYDADESSDSSEPSFEARKLLQKEYDALAAIDGLKLVPAQGGRILCHGWNGAHFSWHMGQFGSFEDLPPQLEKAIENAIEGAA